MILMLRFFVGWAPGLYIVIVDPSILQVNKTGQTVFYVS